MRTLYDKAGDAIRRIYDLRIDGLPVLDAATHFPNASRFLSNWRQIRDEALNVARRIAVPRFEELMPEQAEISAADSRPWQTFIMKAYGRELPDNLRECPVLASLLRLAPEVMSATFSYLAPYKHIPRHRGPFRGIMRYHLGLVMPLGTDGRPATILGIGDQEHRFGDGEGLLWDDTCPHEVWHNSDRPRIALLLDVWRPDMPLDMEILSRLIVGGVRLGMSWRGFTGSIAKRARAGLISGPYRPDRAGRSRNWGQR